MHTETVGNVGGPRQEQIGDLTRRAAMSNQVVIWIHGVWTLREALHIKHEKNSKPGRSLMG